MPYIGTSSTNTTDGLLAKDKDIINRTLNTMTGDNSDTTLTLSMTPASVNNVDVYLDGVRQRPTTDYTVSGTTLTFTTAPPTGVVVIAITGSAEPIGVTTDSFSGSDFETITDAKIASGIASSKLTGTLPALNGSNLTNLPAANLTGTVADARISTLTASKLTGNLPAISGASLTNLPITPAYTKSASDPAITTNPSGGVGTVWVNQSSGEVYVCTDATSNENVWTNVGAGTGDIQPYTGMAATGGTITTDGDYKVHTFNSSGTFQITTLGSDAVVEYLVIAGGGSGGGGGDSGGGGGAGGYLAASNFSVSQTSYTVTVGAGGAAYTGTSHVQGNDGSNSIFSTITSTGGGGGGHNETSPCGGRDGGSGGGASKYHGNYTSCVNGGSAVAGQGNDGGDASSSDTTDRGCGGGGKGSAGATTSSGNGGNGLASSITGSSVTRAGGGGGGAWAPSGGSGGSGGGGNGGSYNSNTGGGAGTVNTGSGGGSGTGVNGRGGTGAGGKGVVIIRYKYQ